MTRYEQLALDYEGMSDDEKRGVRFALKAISPIDYRKFEVARFVIRHPKYQEQAQYLATTLKNVFHVFDADMVPVYMDELEYKDATAEEIKCCRACYRLLFTA